MAGFNLPLVNPALGAPEPGSMPSMPTMAPAPASVQNPVPNPVGVPPQNPQSRFQSVLQELLPVLISGIAAKRGGAQAGSAVLTGYAQGQADQFKAKAEQLKAQQLLDTQNQEHVAELQKLNTEKQVKLSSFVNELIKSVSTIDDPAAFASAVELADQTAQNAFGAPAGYISRSLTFNDTKRLEKAKATAQKSVDDFVKLYGRDALDQAIASNAIIDGKPIKDMVALTTYDVRTPEGARMTFDDPNAIKPITSAAEAAKSAVDEARKKAKMEKRPFTQTDAQRVSVEAIKAFNQGTKVETVQPNATGSTGSDAEAIADAIASGLQPPTLTGLYRMAAPVRAILSRKGYDLTRAQQDYNATTRLLNTLNGPQQTRLRQAAQTAYDSLDIIESLNQQLTPLIPRSRFPVFNKQALSAARNGLLGPEAQTVATQLAAQISDLTSELGNVYMGGNSPTDHSLSLAAKNLSGEWTEKQLKDAIELARKNLQIRLNSIALVQPVGGRVENPYTPEVPPPSGGRASGAGPATPPAGWIIK